MNLPPAYARIPGNTERAVPHEPHDPNCFRMHYAVGMQALKSSITGVT